MNFKKSLSCALAAAFFAVSFSVNSIPVNAEIKAPSQEVISSNFEGDENFQKYLDSLPQKVVNARY